MTLILPRGIENRKEKTTRPHCSFPFSSLHSYTQQGFQGQCATNMNRHFFFKKNRKILACCPKKFETLSSCRKLCRRLFENFQMKIYSPLHKYGITPRRSIRRRVFFIWVFSVGKNRKNDINSPNLGFMSFYVFSIVWIFFRFFPLFFCLEKWRTKYRITPTPPVLSYGANGFSYCFLYI
jgi:hypothetical protein